jgi:hypothetical protein
MRFKKTVSVSDLALYCADRDRLLQYKLRPNHTAIAQGNKFHDGEKQSRWAIPLLVFMVIGGVIAWLLL